MKAKSVCTVSKAYKVIAVVWLLAFFLAVPTLVVQVKLFESCFNSCIINNGSQTLDSSRSRPFRKGFLVRPRCRLSDGLAGARNLLFARTNDHPRLDDDCGLRGHHQGNLQMYEGTLSASRYKPNWRFHSKQVRRRNPIPLRKILPNDHLMR